MDKVGLSGKYQTYPEYKDSGVEWFGLVPIAWDQSRLKFESSINMGQSPNSEDCNQDGLGLPFLQGNAEFGIKSPSPKQYCAIPRKVANIGDLLFSVRAPVGALNLADQQYGIGRGLCAITKNENLDSDFLWWVIPVIRSELAAVSTGSTFEAVSAEQVENVLIYLPHIFEQQKIAYFLDHETAKIDTLIEKQQQLIKLLKEKRQAVISHAVTKGLNPNAPMRDSGVEWLGEVPEHWEVKKFTHCASIRNGQVDPTQKPYCDFILIAPNHIESGTGRLIMQESANEQGADSGKYLCKKGEVVYSKIRPALAKVCISPSDNTICSADMYPIQGMSGLMNPFLYWSLLSSWFTSLVILESDRVAMPKINREKLAEVLLPVPPESEQDEINKYIETKTESIDSLISKTNLAISLANERRTALISAAVTGKIDVRDWVAPESSNNTMDSRLRGNDAELNAAVDVNTEADLSKEAGL
ncbi:hypothetical protein CN03_04575 [Thalassolituus oleivorans]|uniref:restriction endonuclease subunit S n=1 Tax=Thalassolituus oleivorans TaxID=187493 RepID=UPI0009494449|nr:restriction endonuclease subunit S [Thalassolituus oleivorans]APR66272.1 hypothetical protein CN03_04575 [Thalassolituus oleivorans]